MGKWLDDSIRVRIGSWSAVCCIDMRGPSSPGFRCRPSCLGDAGEVILPMLAYAGSVGKLEVR